jgi:hypothetical protein
VERTVLKKKNRKILMILGNNKLIFRKKGLPSLAGSGPKYYIGPLKPNAPTKKKNI